MYVSAVVITLSESTVGARKRQSMTLTQRKLLFGMKAITIAHQSKM